MDVKIALAGNPNCGKTTLFNALTGATAHVGNWPGVTVDKREGVYKFENKTKKGAKNGSENDINIMDLPGIYSLSPYTPEEVISRNFILEDRPDGIINIVDATNLERNLYLTTQLLETDVPVIIALNMMDEVEKSGDKINAQTLERALGVPVVEISALKGMGIKQLMERAVAMPAQRKGSTVLKGALEKQLETVIVPFAADGSASYFTLSENGEEYAAAAIGKMAVNEDDVPVFKLSIYFLEMTSARHIKFFFRGKKITVQFTESADGMELLDGFRPMIEDYADKNKAVKLILSKTDAGLVEYNLEKLFSPEFPAEEIR